MPTPTKVQDLQEALRVREIDLLATKQRCQVLERTCAEWHDALQRNRTECEKWRRRCLATTTSEAATVSANFLRQTEDSTEDPGDASCKQDQSKTQAQQELLEQQELLLHGEN